MKLESKDQRVSHKWEWCLSCSLLVLSLVVSLGMFFYSTLVMSIKHPECILPRLTELSFITAYMPLITSTSGIILVACMVHRGATGRFLSFWRVICLITVVLITFTLAGAFLPCLPNSCEFR
jgi:hypothetical protein